MTVVEAYAQGQNHILSVYLQAASFAGPFYVGLGTGGVPDGRNKTLADVTEVTGTGYARIAVTRDGTASGWTIADNVGSSPTLSFTNSSLTTDWEDADYAFLTLSPSGTTAPNILLTAGELGTSFTLGPGEEQEIIFKFNLYGP